MTNDIAPVGKSAADKVRELHSKIPGYIAEVTVNGAMSSAITETIKYKLEEILKDIEPSNEGQ